MKSARLGFVTSCDATRSRRKIDKNRRDRNITRVSNGLRSIIVTGLSTEQCSRGMECPEDAQAEVPSLRHGVMKIM